MHLTNWIIYCLSDYGIRGQALEVRLTNAQNRKLMCTLVVTPLNQPSRDPLISAPNSSALLPSSQIIDSIIDGE